MIESFDHVDIVQGGDGIVSFVASQEDSTTQLAMYDLYQEILRLRSKLAINTSPKEEE